MLRFLALLGFMAAAGWTPQSSPTHASLRGLCPVSATVAWASGTGGTFLRTTDGGAHWIAAQVPGAARLDFRDIKAFSAELAYMIAVGPQGGIFKTEDGGAHWSEQYRNSDSAFFLDGITFWDARHGLALGDPIRGHFLLLRTDDGGAHWRADAQLPPALAGEGAFAASGTALVAGPGRRAWFATGGVAGARVFRSDDGGRTWQVATTPMAQPGGPAGAGIFSLAFSNSRDGIAAGGDYTHPEATARTVATTHDGGRTWQLASPAAGYRSAIVYLPGSHGRELLAVGPTGSDFSRDSGATWTPVPASPALNSVAASSNGTIWAVGPHGTILRWHP